MAVILNADDLSDSEMLGIANWTNLSETTFVQASKNANYLLRIFTPRGEIPFAGHPTIGSAYALREAGIIPDKISTFQQECKGGIIPLTVGDNNLIFAQTPSPKISRDRLEVDVLYQAIGKFPILEPLFIDVGPVWLTARLDNSDDLENLQLDFDRIAKVSLDNNCLGLTVYAIDDNSEVHIRSFAPAAGTAEDPGCGSGNACVAAHIRTTDLTKLVGLSYTAHQGSALGRDGHIQVKIEGDEVFIGGNCVTVIDGEITI